MLISMQEAIAQALIWENNKFESDPMQTRKGEWNAFTVKDVISRPDIQELLIRYANNGRIYFQDDISEVELSRTLDKIVIAQVTGLIDNDFRPPQLVGSVFSPEQIEQLTAANPGLLFNLKSAVDELKDRPFKWMQVREFLPALATLENIKRPDFGLQVATNKEEAIAKIGEWVKSGQEHGRIAYMTDANDVIHGKYLDCKLVDGKPSILWLDSWHVHATSGEFHNLQKELKVLSQNLGKDILLGGVELLNQGSDHGCPIFALNTAKQAFKDQNGLNALHQKNIDLPLEAHRKLESDTSLPAHFMKHTQSSRRLGEYLGNNPQATTTSVNNKGETLEQYRAKHTLYSKLDNGTYMRSIYEKRLAYLAELQAAFGMS